MPRSIVISPNDPVLPTTDIGPSAAAHMDLGAAYRGLANLASDVKEVAQKIGAQQGAEDGKGAVSQDPETGELKLAKLPIPITAYGAAYRHAALAAYATQSETDQHAAIGDIAIQNPSDPDKFVASAQGWLKGQIANAPAETRGDLLRTGTDLISQYRLGVATKRSQIDQEKFVNSTRSLIDLKSNQYVQLVAQPGGAQTPEADKLHQEIGNLYQSLVDNPLSGYTKEQADAGMLKIQSRGRIEAMVRQLDSGTIGLATVEAAINDPSLDFKPDEVVALTNRAESTFRAQEVERNRADIAAAKRAGQVSDDTLKDFFDLKAAGKLTVGIIQQNKDKLNAADYRTAYSLLGAEGVERDDPNTYADLVLSKDSTAPDQYKGAIASALKRGLLRPETANTLLNQNDEHFKTDAPASAYKQGYEYVKNSLDVNPFVVGSDYGTKKQTQANALVEYDQWAQKNANASPSDSLAVAQGIVNRYAAQAAVATPGTLGSPYGFRGQLGAVSGKDVQAATARLKAARQAGQISDAQFVAETNRLTAWAAFLNKQPATQTKAP